ncbi:DUF3168 domain-containing protein [Maricaulis sp.]|uniref:DUF3168 domain-containing protein n=1 Tax=unclassified Maricaulis TaxID=2632371 RepID=UPI001B0489B1|nr:DUF3168 domain-containing protein [Maricaulis sp.]MBO6797140.1 DUF3168 domain-containing protein [Maricaulis sp.]
MSAASQIIREAISTALAASPEAQALFGDPLRLADRPSRHLAFPHLSWGRAQTSDKSADGVDLIELRQDLMVWEQEGDAPALTGQLRTLLRQLTINVAAPWCVISLVPVFTDTFNTNRLGVRRGLIRLRAVMGQIEEPTS